VSLSNEEPIAPPPHITAANILHALTEGDGEDRAAAYQWCIRNSRHLNISVLLRLVSDDRTPQELLTQLTHHPEYSIRAIVACAKHHTEDTWFRLATDPSTWVRRVVKNSEHAPDAAKVVALLSAR